MTSKNSSKNLLRNKFFILTALISTIILAGCGTKTITYTTIDQKDLNLSFERPDDWTDEKVSPGQEYVDYTINIPGTSSSSNRLNGTLGISVINAPTDTLLKLEDEVETFKNLFKDAKEMKVLIEADAIMLEEKAKEITLTFKNAEDENVQEKVVGTVTVHNNKVYVVVLDEEEGEWNEHLLIYQKLRDSLRAQGTSVKAAESAKQ